jgi:hypothetical protein
MRPDLPADIRELIHNAEWSARAEVKLSVECCGIAESSGAELSGIPTVAGNHNTGNRFSQRTRRGETR